MKQRNRKKHYEPTTITTYEYCDSKLIRMRTPNSKGVWKFSKRKVKNNMSSNRHKPPLRIQPSRRIMRVIQGQRLHYAVVLTDVRYFGQHYLLPQALTCYSKCPLRLGERTQPKALQKRNDSASTHDKLPNIKRPQ